LHRYIAADCDAGGELEVDLPAQVIRRPDGSEIAFDVDAFRKNCLINGGAVVQVPHVTCYYSKFVI
jgi:3-isopropylmalate dehydratase small subunit